MMKNMSLGALLLQENIIKQEEIDAALKIQDRQDPRQKIGEVLLDQGFVSSKELLEVLSAQLGYDIVDLFEHEINLPLIKKFPLPILKEAMALPFKEDEDTISIATSDPLDFEFLDNVERFAGNKEIIYYLCEKKDIKHFFQRISILKGTEAIVKEVKQELSQKGYSEGDGEESAVMRLIRLLVKDAVMRNASDLHLEPTSNECSVRMRIDGVLHEAFVFDKEIYVSLSSRIKILGNLDISERRKSQDGRFELSLDGHPYDFRLSTTPTLHGESIVMRILDREKVLLRVHDLGFSERNIKSFEEIIHQPYGIILLTGPTGSGKTTSLYAIVNEIKSVENKVMTIEDPIEYQLPLIQQVQVDEHRNFTFAEALRGFLRQDPDIIMVGEIRDKETLNAATQASLTGHLVLSTLHTNDATGGINRMIQMGLDPYLIADALLGIVSQRLVRKICSSCKKEAHPHKSILNRIKRWLPEAEKYQFYRGEGCSKCEMTGYLGRTLIGEVLRVNRVLAQRISEGASKQEIERIAIEEKLYYPMIHDGLKKAVDGETTIEEILRVTRS